MKDVIEVLESSSDVPPGMLPGGRRGGHAAPAAPQKSRGAAHAMVFTPC